MNLTSLEREEELWNNYILERSNSNQNCSKYVKIMASLGIVRGLLAFVDPFPKNVQLELFMYLTISGLWSILIASNLYLLPKKLGGRLGFLESRFGMICVLNTGIVMLYTVVIIYGHEDIEKITTTNRLLMMFVAIYCGVSTAEAFFAYFLYEVAAVIALDILDSPMKTMHVTKGFIILSLCILSQRRHEQKLFANYKLQKSLETRDKLLINILEASKDAVIVIDPDSKKTAFYNTPAVILFSPTPDLEQNMMVYFEKLQSNNGSFYTEIKKILSSSKGEWVEGSTRRLYSFSDALGSERTYLITTVKTMLDNVRKGLGIIIKDMTQIKLLEEAKELERYKQSILCTFSHEMRTPLIGVCGVFRILKEMAENNLAMKEAVRTGMSSAKLFICYVNRMLDYFLHLSGKLQAVMEDCNLKKLLNKSMKIVRPQLSPNVSFDLNVDLHVPAILKTDSERFIRLLVNILSNASKYTTKGRISLSAVVSNGELVISVADTGYGMTSEKVDEIMHLFCSHTKRRIKGTQKNIPTGTKLAGIGLETCSILAELIQGRLTVESVFQKGSTFSLHLPLTEEIPLLQTSSPLSARADIPDEKMDMYEIISKLKRPKEKIDSPTVLVVDDNNTNRYVLSAMLLSHGLKVIEATNGIEAVKLVQSNYRKIALILMDIEMPIMDGIEATSIIRDKYPSIPIVAVTAYCAEIDFKKCEENGMKAFVQKPVAKKQLLEILKRYVVHKH